jgi:hypothetical protein
MKTTYIITGLLLVCFGASCSRTLESEISWQENSYPRLVVVDSLLQSDPDSALKYLDQFYESVSPVLSPSFEYMSLMLSEAYFKVRREVAYCDEVGDALKYFDSVSSVFPRDKDMAFLAARAHYMNGICINNGIIYMLYDENILGVSLEVIEYCGIKKDKVLSLLKSNQNNSLIYSSSRGINRLSKFLGNKKYAVPYFIST